jgi:multiple sugar transport system permease protein
MKKQSVKLPQKEKFSFFHNKIFIGYMFVVPAMIYMIILIGYPLVYNIILSFQNVTAMTLAKGNYKFIGLDNFRALIEDPVFLPALLHTIYYTLGSLLIQFVLGFILALFFNEGFSFAKPIRGLIVISWILPVTVTALNWKFMFAEGNGIINALLINLNFIKQPIGWLINGETAMWGLILANSWIGIPFNMLLLTTGLANIPDSLYEAANIDGASIFQRFTQITLPLLKSTMMSVLVLGFIYTFKVFDLVYVMTAGGPVSATEVMSTYSYKLSFNFYRFGQGAAAANILFICLFAIALLYLRTVSNEESLS